MHKVLHKPWGEWAHTDQVDVALARASRHQLEPRECEPPLDGTRIRHQLMTPVDATSVSHQLMATRPVDATP